MEVSDAAFEMPTTGELGAAVIVPSLTAMLMAPTGGRRVFCVNTNPGYVTRDSAGAIVPGSSTSLLEISSEAAAVGDGPDGPEGPDYDICNIHVLLPHPVHILDAAGNMTRTLCVSGDPGRSAFVEATRGQVLTTHGAIPVVTGSNEIPRFAVPQTATHDGILVSANLFGILKTHGVVGDAARMAAVFGRNDFSLLLVDNDRMVRDKSSGRILGTQGLVCVAKCGR